MLVFEYFAVMERDKVAVATYYEYCLRSVNCSVSIHHTSHPRMLHVEQGGRLNGLLSRKMMRVTCCGGFVVIRSQVIWTPMSDLGPTRLCSQPPSSKHNMRENILKACLVPSVDFQRFAGNMPVYIEAVQHLMKIN